MRAPILVASVLPADFSALGQEVMQLENAGVDRIQWDVMDGRFVPNLTFGRDVIAATRAHVSLGFEAHLMVDDPDAMLPRWVDAGCEIVVVHAEATRHLHRTLSTIRDLGARRCSTEPRHTAGGGDTRAALERPAAGDDGRRGLRRPAVSGGDGTQSRRPAPKSTAAVCKSNSRWAAESPPQRSGRRPAPAQLLSAQARRCSTVPERWSTALRRYARRPPPR